MPAAGDRFRDPVGYTNRQGVARLTEQLLGDFDEEQVATALGPIMRIRAVQDLTADEAVAFVRFASGWAPEDRVERLEAIARRLYDDCRAQIEAIRDRQIQQRREFRSARTAAGPVSEQPIRCSPPKALVTWQAGPLRTGARSLPPADNAERR